MGNRRPVHCLARAKGCWEWGVEEGGLQFPSQAGQTQETAVPGPHRRAVGPVRSQRAAVGIRLRVARLDPIAGSGPGQIIAGRAGPALHEAGPCSITLPLPASSCALGITRMARPRRTSNTETRSSFSWQPERRIVSSAVIEDHQRNLRRLRRTRL